MIFTWMFENMTKCSLCNAPATHPFMNINDRKYHRCDSGMASNVPVQAHPSSVEKVDILQERAGLRMRARASIG